MLIAWKSVVFYRCFCWKSVVFSCLFCWKSVIMLYRKIEKEIENHLLADNRKILIVDGARQVGKSYIIRHVGQRLFPNYIELNMEADKLNKKFFAEAKTVEDFYIALSVVAGEKMKERENTLVFVDEIQAYDHLLTLLKFLSEDNRFTYIASGSLLGVTLRQTSSVPIGSILIKHMYPMDFEEFLVANHMGKTAIDAMTQCFEKRQSLTAALHEKMMDLCRKYLLVGGMPDAVKQFVETQNIVEVRNIQKQIHQLYAVDASRYESEHRRLKIQRIFQMVPSNMENKKKRMVAKDIEGKSGKRMADYSEEFDYLISAGIALEVKAISKPSYPLLQNATKNLLKLYINDVGILTSLLYGNNILPIMQDEISVNLGAVYESVVAQELRASGLDLYYYDNKKHGEVDFLIDNVAGLSVTPIEVKSGKDYRVHSALTHFLSTPEYHVKEAIVLSNHPNVYQENGVTYMPIYFMMFLV